MLLDPILPPPEVKVGTGRGPTQAGSQHWQGPRTVHIIFSMGHGNQSRTVFPMGHRTRPSFQWGMGPVQTVFQGSQEWHAENMRFRAHIPYSGVCASETYSPFGGRLLPPLYGTVTHRLFICCMSDRGVCLLTRAYGL